MSAGNVSIEFDRIVSISLSSFRVPSPGQCRALVLIPYLIFLSGICAAFSSQIIIYPQMSFQEILPSVYGVLQEVCFQAWSVTAGNLNST